MTHDTAIRKQGLDSRSPARASVPYLGGALLCLVMLAGCEDAFPGWSGPVGLPGEGLECALPLEMLADGGAGLDAIPSLHNPDFVSPDHSAADYLEETDRVVGLVVDGVPWAVPLNIGWWHEIINLDFPSGLQVAVTHCPLTGSSLVFDRAAAGGATFGVSGLLVMNNLVLFERRHSDQIWWDSEGTSSLWVQMMREARCGPASGRQLDMYPAIETTWAGWKELHPETVVVGDEIELDRDQQSFPRQYDVYPYGTYESTENLLSQQPEIDRRRFAKERTLGVPGRTPPVSETEPLAGRSAILFPFGVLRDAHEGPVAVAEGTDHEGDFVVFWDERVEGAMAFRPEVAGVPVSFTVEGDRIVDRETGSTWRVDGVAMDGPSVGQRLPPVPEAYVAFWFAWAAFHPDAEIWAPGD
ncbi:MAG: DUF3179 domain-containing (seleno)protein [Gemmatimonadota bacterium]